MSDCRKPYARPLIALNKILRIDEAGITTEKWIREDEPYFIGHFPGKPIYPGVFIIEAVNQAARHYSDEHSLCIRLREVVSAHFVAPVFPADILRTDCFCQIDEKENILHVKGICSMNGEKVADVKLRYTIEIANDT